MIAVLGTGLLGSGMVEHALSRGETVRVWNRTASKTAPLVAKGAIPCATPAEAFAGAERVHLVLAEDDAVDAVLASVEFDDTLVIDHSTNLPARVAARAARLHADGVAYVHAPVFMGPKDAAAGRGMIAVSGPASLVARAMPALTVMTGTVWNAGVAPERAAVYKLCGNAVFIGMSGVMGDVLAIGEHNGLDAKETLTLFDVLKPTVAWAGARVASARTGTPSFQLPMARKDVGLMITASGGSREALVVLPAIADAMDAAIEKGHGEHDYAVFARPGKLS